MRLLIEENWGCLTDFYYFVCLSIFKDRIFIGGKLWLESCFLQFTQHFTSIEKNKEFVPNLFRLCIDIDID